MSANKRLTAERDSLLWALTVRGYRIAFWCDNVMHHDGCDCDGDDDTSPECAEVNDWLPALLEVDANHGDQFVCWLPSQSALATFGQAYDRSAEHVAVDLSGES